MSQKKIIGKCSYSISCWEFDDNMDATLETATLAVTKVKLTINNFFVYTKLSYLVTSSRLHTKWTEMWVLLIFWFNCQQENKPVHDGRDCMHTVHVLTWCCPDIQSLVWEWPYDGTSYKERCRGRLHSAETHRHTHRLLFCNKQNA